jgi:hypothetical protein
MEIDDAVRDTSEVRDRQSSHAHLLPRGHGSIIAPYPRMEASQREVLKADVESPKL